MHPTITPKLRHERFMNSLAKHSLFALMLIVPGSYSVASANNIYVGQSASGLGNGQDCANTKDVTYFNTSAYWVKANPVGAQIGPGTTVHLCGTFSFPSGGSGLVVKGSGLGGNPITIVFESGAILQSPNFSGNGGAAIVMLSKSNIVVDGGTPCGATTAGDCR
jgi:hypothetical protein